MPCWDDLNVTTAIQQIPLQTIDGSAATLGDYQGDVLLVVNVASKCGLTPQYEALERLYEEFRDRGFAVLGFPANDFAGQEPGNNEEIVEFCTGTYGVQFPMFSKITVTGAGKHPLYAELTTAVPQARGDKEAFRGNLRGYGMTPTEDPEVLWNFEKFLVSARGEVVDRFAPDVTPDDEQITAAIERELQVRVTAPARRWDAVSRAVARDKPGDVGGHPAIMADVEEVEVVVAHNERATLRVGDVFLKIDADQTRTDVEVEAMAMAPVPTPEILWRKPPVLALAALPGTALGRLGEPSTASPAAWAAAGAAARMLHDAPLPPWPGRSLDEIASRPRRRMRVARRQRRPSRRPGHAQPPARRDCAPAVDTGVHPRRPAGRPRVRRR